jgi:hypothetical protein
LRMAYDSHDHGQQKNGRILQHIAYFCEQINNLSKAMPTSAA